MKRHPDTWKGWNNYLWDIYSEYEKKYFRGRMPKFVSVSFGIVPSIGNDLTMTCVGSTADYDRQFGRAAWTEWEICIDWTIKGYDDIVCITMLHEMAHVAVERKHPAAKKHPHGPLWRAEIRRLMRAGAYDDLL